MSVRVRFAPSPTGDVHIGNIRAAIFNWLFARHEAGKFLLRIEDTDRERSTPRAIAGLLDMMQWLALDYDESPLYQSSRTAAHAAAARGLLADGAAYRSAPDDHGNSAVIFRIPWAAETCPNVVRVGETELAVHPDVPVTVSHAGVSFAQVSKKGKPMPAAACLAGFLGLEIRDAAGAILFRLDGQLQSILDERQVHHVENAATLRFVRRQVEFEDIVKGTLAKPLDSMKDLVILRGDGSPVFHLANVCDDAFQDITHVVRGDDHVENTYRHILLYHALGLRVPQYAHLPMITNEQGKPYSKRDGDAYVGEFRRDGYLAHALFNYLSLLGWSPGDDREKLARPELVELFTLQRVQSSPARVDLKKLENLNGQYMAELPLAEFTETCRQFARQCPWYSAAEVDDAYLDRVAALLHTRTKRFTQVCEWGYFFQTIPSYDEAACRKYLGKPGVAEALDHAIANLAAAPFDAAGIEAAVHAATDTAGMKQGKLNQPLRLAVTGRTTGAGVYETIELLGRDRVLDRIRHARRTFLADAETETDT